MLQRHKSVLTGLLLSLGCISCTSKAHADVFKAGEYCEDAALIGVEIFQKAGPMSSNVTDVAGTKYTAGTVTHCACPCPKGEVKTVPSISRTKVSSISQGGEWNIGINFFDKLTIGNVNQWTKEQQEQTQVTIDPSGVDLPCGKKHYQAFWTKRLVQKQTIYTTPGHCEDAKEVKDNANPPANTLTAHERVLTVDYWYGEGTTMNCDEACN